MLCFELGTLTKPYKISLLRKKEAAHSGAAFMKNFNQVKD